MTKKGLGFITLSSEEVEVLLGFNSYHELYFPEFIKAHTGLEASRILHSLIHKGLVIEGKPYTLTRAGKTHLKQIKTND